MIRLNNLEDTYHHFFEDIPTPMWIFDTSSLRFLAVNENAIGSYGYTRAEFLDMNTADLLPSAHYPAYETAIQDNTTDHAGFDEGYVLHKKKDGTAFYAHVLTNATIYNGVDARVVQAIDVNDKILTQKKLDELRVSQEKLKVREQELKETIAQKNVINKQLERFSYIVAHDIKSPFSSVWAVLNSLKDDDRIRSHEDLLELVEGVMNTSGHLSELVDSILDYSKKSEQEQYDTLVDVHELVMQIMELLSPQRKTTIRVEGTLPVFETKLSKLRQVFQNLLSNAIKYNDKDLCEIVVGCKEEAHFYRFYVKDNGYGILKNDIDRIFYLFQTTENKSNSADSSTGIGLNILKMLVEEQGGNIHVESTPAVGSCFYFQWRK